MEVIIEHVKDVEFRVAARGHRVICDQPLENAGSDAGMSPPEFLLTSLGTCAGYYAAQYLKTRSLPIEGLAVRVSAEKASAPARLSSFRIEITTPPLEERHREGVMRAVKSCLIHNTLLNPPVIDTMLRTADACVPTPV
ncbi:MAG TPA: OsmC family protein [Bryobacteraceae bacterium]|nr:OsmC family protein [Bryobacteraceae bacterium]